VTEERLEGGYADGAVLQVILAEVAVEGRGVGHGEVAVDPLGGQPRVQVLGRADVGIDRPLLIRPPVSVVGRLEVVLELRQRRLAILRATTGSAGSAVSAIAGRPGLA
jgi:hypothetical protein